VKNFDCKKTKKNEFWQTIIIVTMGVQKYYFIIA